MGMESVIEQITDDISAKIPKSESEYIGKDGFTHCSVCHAQTQTIIVNPFTGKEKVVRCICDCRKKELNEYKERERRQELDRMRRVCFAETNMQHWTFENDDRSNPKVSDAMRKYADNFAEFKTESKGLLLHGNTGTGKTYFAACIANSLIDKGYTVLMTNFATLTNKLQGMFDGKHEFISSLNRYSLLIIDDLGTERSSDYMKEQVFNIIDSRYRSGLPFIITTNLSTDELKNQKDIGYARIYDRIIERCFPVEVAGASRRRKSVKDTYFDVKERLGL